MKYKALLLLTICFFFCMTVSSVGRDIAWWKEDYEEYIESEELEADFPFYQDSWSILGEFSEFYKESIPTTYRYWFVDEYGNRNVLIISKDRKNRSFGEINTSPESDLRKNSQKDSACRVGCLIYTYGYDGSLCYIMWEDDLYRYYLGDKYTPISLSQTEGFVSSLLSLETAEEAGEQLIAAVSGEQESAWLWIALPVGAVVIVGGATFALLCKKRRKVSSENIPELSKKRNAEVWQ